MPHNTRPTHYRMPASSKSKAKRSIVTSADGWTHVLPSNGAPIPVEMLDEGSALAPVEAAMTLAEVHKAYGRVKHAWTESKTADEVNRLVQSLAGRDALVQATRGVCLGLGSLSSARGGSMGDAMWQLVAFLELMNALSGPVKSVSMAEQGSDSGLALFAQDPMFNDVDKAFLKEVGVKLMQHPEGFLNLDVGTCLFNPHLAVEGSLRAMRTARVGLLVDHDFDILRQGRLQGRPLDADDQDMLDEFMQNHDHVAFPQLENRPTAFNDMRVYWKKQGEENA